MSDKRVAAFIIITAFVLLIIWILFITACIYWSA